MTLMFIWDIQNGRKNTPAVGSSSHVFQNGFKKPAKLLALTGFFYTLMLFRKIKRGSSLVIIFLQKFGEGGI